MALHLRPALAAGSERVIAWADVLDRINVFPVPDGDTGRNLVFSLSPLRRTDRDPEKMKRDLLISARGNSGNIASRFFSGVLVRRQSESLADCCARGRDLAYRAVGDPKPGTMLTLFDALVEALQKNRPDGDQAWVRPVLAALEDEVRRSTQQLPALKKAGVVDAGALGMFIFFESFISVLAGLKVPFTSIGQIFSDSIELAETWRKDPDQGYCLDVVLKVAKETAAAERQVGSLGESIVTMTNGDMLKVHLHAANQAEVRAKLATLGEIVSWSADDLAAQTEKFSRSHFHQAVHVMTDAAGSITREDALDLGMTLLDSYVNIGESSLPETYLDPAIMFEAMNQGLLVSTSQASVLERHQHYHKVMSLYPRVLYICVGSAFTGNYGVALDWKAENDPEDRFTVLDSGAASGRLGLAAMAIARLARQDGDRSDLAAKARLILDNCQEYVFLDKLLYLARGGRLSRTGAFFGDALRIKPVITPRPEGAVKVGVVRSRGEQVKMALDLLEKNLDPGQGAMIMLEYSDNRSWLETEIEPEVARIYQGAEIFLRPVSLTSGAHMGPGTWGIAFLGELY